MRILVTGGAGFVGSHLTDRLLKEGHRVIILDDLSTGRLSNLSHLTNDPDLEFIEGSILSETLISKLMGSVDGCFHLAAAVGVNLIVENPLQSLTTNIKGSEVVLEAAAANNVRTLVTSTSEIYGKNTSDSLSEDDDRILGSPLKIRWTYSEAKAIEEALAYTLWRQSALPSTIVRLFNTVGPRQTGHYGMVVPRFCSAALSNSPLTVYGSGTQSRVFCHIQDVVEAMWRLFSSSKTIGNVYNIGGKEEISMWALALRVIEIAKSDSVIAQIPYDQAYEPGFEDMYRRVPNIDKIREEIGWTPSLNLDQIISDVLDYQRSTGLD